jgi:hypothetical protein
MLGGELLGLEASYNFIVGLVAVEDVLGGRPEGAHEFPIARAQDHLERHRVVHKVNLCFLGIGAGWKEALKLGKL